jgi:leader peptidase (prepilin peptidase) / N-methyltransferase
MQVIGITVAVGLGAGALGWWFRASRLAARWAEAAAAAGARINQALPPVTWPLSTGFSTSVVLFALLPGHHARFVAGAFAPWAVASIVVWACGLALLALTDSEQLVLPSKLLSTCAVATVGLVLAGCAASGEWRYLWQGALCAVIAGSVFASWALLRPGQLGFGDARMAALVAFGAGMCSPAGCLVALACGPLLAGAVSNFGGKAKKTAAPSPVALGPFLAVGGIAVVVGCAF